MEWKAKWHFVEVLPRAHTLHCQAAKLERRVCPNSILIYLTLPLPPRPYLTLAKLRYTPRTLRVILDSTLRAAAEGLTEPSFRRLLYNNNRVIIQSPRWPDNLSPHLKVYLLLTRSHIELDLGLSFKCSPATQQVSRPGTD